MRSERNPGCLRLIADEILPSYIGILTNQYKDPVINQPGFNGMSEGFINHCSPGILLPKVKNRFMITNTMVLAGADGRPYFGAGVI